LSGSLLISHASGVAVGVTFANKLVSITSHLGLRVLASVFFPAHRFVCQFVLYNSLLIAAKVFLIFFYDFVALFIEGPLGLFGFFGDSVGFLFGFAGIQHHLFEILVVVKVSLLFLFLHFLPLFALLFDTTSAKGLSSTSIVFEDWPVIEVGESGNLVSQSLTVVLDSLGTVVLEQIQNFQIRHFHEDFLKAGLVMNFIILEVNYF